jgi:hypothetical protein
MKPEVVWLHPHAPAKPAPGEDCNGCGLCCAATPCPLGMLASRSVHGPCALLRWSDEHRRYVCGALVDATGVDVTGWRARLAARWIAAGAGCDCRLEPDEGAVRTPRAPSP